MPSGLALLPCLFNVLDIGVQAFSLWPGFLAFFVYLIVSRLSDNNESGFSYDLILLICFSSLSLQFHNTRSQKGEKEKDKQPDVPLDSDEEPADADLSLMARTKRLAKEAKAADLRRQLAELEDQEDSPVESDVDPDQAQDHPSKDMGAFFAAAVSFLSL